MHHNLLLILSLLFVVFMLVMLGQRLKISYPIFLVLAGLGIGFIPGLPRFTIDPELIFLIFLPPLLYEAAWYTSWNDFWKWKRPISLLAFGAVIFTSVIIAYVSQAMIPGFTLALGFVLGGIISPPDAVAATSVLKHVKVPKRALTILEGESLVNDASSLIVFRFAVVAVTTGQFVMHQALVDFFLAAGMGILIGLAIAHVMYALHRFLPTTPSIDAALTVMTPYFMYIAAEHFHYSGVLAVVSGGLFLSYRSHEIFTNGATRMQMLGVWSTLIFVLNGIIFILIGLELPTIVEGLGDYSIREAIIYGLVISAITILVRLCWVYPATFVPRWLSKKIRTNEPSPGWKGPLVVSWAGMRGVVSLASALSIPLLAGGQAFPHRNLILFITFIVILVTLVFQGLTLPLLIRLIKIKEIDNITPEDEQEAGIELHLMKVALARLEEKYAREITENELAGFLKKDLEHHIANNRARLESLECNETEKEEIEQYHHILRDLYTTQRQELFRLRQHNSFSDEIIRGQELQLDLDELKISKATH
ncbi:Na+/H+ antiporter [Chitinophaga solisilvae]|uniref:Na+/H+ antiporter n=1 Tax=Chitinophaga solisilvae TaxID=1233460 RepID=A0A3S1BL67_9BACT|nr:Na+/H+ antiporter [Chitinophaga solisilvae]NSL89845.1 Na+/H+ antiporter [Chitinophaga solisilvae]